MAPWRWHYAPRQQCCGVALVALARSLVFMSARVSSVSKARITRRRVTPQAHTVPAPAPLSCPILSYPGLAWPVLAFTGLPGLSCCVAHRRRCSDAPHTHTHARTHARRPAIIPTPDSRLPTPDSRARAPSASPSVRPSPLAARARTRTHTHVPDGSTRMYTDTRRARSTEHGRGGPRARAGACARRSR